jgi:hypothetical protein
MSAISGVLETALSIVYPGTLGRYFTAPSCYAHHRIWKHFSKNYGDELVARINALIAFFCDFAAQIVLSPFTIIGCAINICVIPVIPFVLAYEILIKGNLM